MGRPAITTLAAWSDPADLYPVDLGRWWVYQTWHTQGAQPEKPGQEQRMEVARSVAEGQVLRRFYGTWEAPPTLVRRSTGAVVLSRFVADGPQATDSITILRLPLAAGAEWPGRTLAGASERIVAIGREEVSVPAGTFRVWHVQHRLSYAAGGGDTLDYWYAGGVGMVQAIERITLQAGGQPLEMRVRALLSKFSGR